MNTARRPEARQPVYPAPVKVRRVKTGEWVDPGAHDVQRMIDDADLPGPLKLMLRALLSFVSKEEEDAQRWSCHPYLRSVVRKCGAANLTPGRKYRSRRQGRRNLRELEARGLVATFQRTGRATLYVLHVGALKDAADVARQEDALEEADQFRVPEASRPQHLEPMWLPEIPASEDRDQVGGMVRDLVEAVLGRQADTSELATYAKLCLKLWRDRDCPTAEVLVKEVRRVVEVCEDGCQHKTFLWLRGEDIRRPGHGKHAKRRGHNWTRNPRSVLDPQHFEVRLDAAMQHQAQAACGCRWAPSGRMSPPQMKTDAQLEQLASRRTWTGTRLLPILLEELRRTDPGLLDRVGPKMRAELLDASIEQRWPLVLEHWMARAWPWVLGALGATDPPPSAGAV